MLITKKKLEELNACREAVEFFEKYYKEIDIADLLRDVVKYEQEVVEEHNGDVYKWSYWLIVRSISRTAAVRFAIFSAEKVLHIFEERYPLDDRPRKAIAAAKAYLENPSDKNARAVDAAADAAADAAVNAEANASDAAYAADAIWAAANAARSTYAANYAARSTYAAYADPSIKDQILEFGIKLIQEEEK